MTRPAAVLDGNFAQEVGGGGMFLALLLKGINQPLSPPPKCWGGEGSEGETQRESPPEMPNLMILQLL